MPSSLDYQTVETLEHAIAQVKRGDKEAYTHIIHRFQKQIYLYCYYLLGSKEEAEDAVQDIFIKGFQRIHLFEPQVSFSAWIYKIAYNHCLDILNRRSRRRKILSLLKRDQINDQELKYEDLVYQLLDKLSTEERHILLLRAVEEYSFDEISEIMDIKPSTIRKKYERLRKKLLRYQASPSTEEGGLHKHVIKPS
ncbi:RNA polymerase sigma factor [Paenibacillus alvei]|uniref:RNA polymerase sigma factor n=1 Tax=Paenibacillus alvei TaxID=44250 RepID=A0ABT4H557_PAEAL|nr:RNA polymerase sigma factor [Paenibacillus alvei]EJW18930.1 RNA polymerase sigma factor SigW [Paenibacillus alvei DSM 29]MCY9539287.1 RNA polymerase sigma factor [Paenibacillus alvei]MCY9706038.1 RNA polymerase sigma factor [Paenibacillus alvei]MCY9736748.1 RNA polymerase sigma factor [Paenibacillus alvei]MCY9755551.1 RNA polymerase sigma factor [Paenibacillus alvei]